MPVIANRNIEGVRYGCMNEHEPTKCSECIFDRPCQYESEGEYMKLGTCDIKEGDQFSITWQNNDWVQLTCKDKFLYDLPASTFAHAFDEKD